MACLMAGVNPLRKSKMSTKKAIVAGTFLPAKSVDLGILQNEAESATKALQKAQSNLQKAQQDFIEAEQRYVTARKALSNGFTAIADSTKLSV